MQTSLEQKDDRMTGMQRRIEVCDSCKPLIANTCAVMILIKANWCVLLT